MAEETQTLEKVLYDANAHQRVPLKIVQDGARYEVAHIFLPLDEQALALLLDASDDDRPVVLSGFWVQHIKNLEGYQDDADITEVPFDERLSAVNEGLLLSVIVPKAPTGKPSSRRTRQDYQLRSLFDGQFVETTLQLANYNAEHYRVWQRVEAGVYPIKFGDQLLKSYSEAVKALFVALSEGSDGYANRIPLHHVEAVVRQHFTGQSAAVLAKKS